MENASKALIIAGAILLSILIIGLGMLVFNQAREALSGSNLDAEKAQAFNSKFMEYTGSQVTGIQLKNLIDLMISNNNTVETTENPTIHLVVKASTGITAPTGVNLSDINTSGHLSALRNKVINSARFSVTPTKYEAGLITEITVE